jgi:hypothetical protein
MAFTVQELRKELRAAGYKLSVKTYSDFKSGEIRAPNGDGLTGYFTPEGLVAHRARHAAAFDILDKYKGQTFDGDFRVVLS